MTLKSGRLGNNPLLKREKRNSEIEDSLGMKKEKIVKQYGRLIHMSEKLINQIDFKDTTFINRLEIKEEDLELDELKESIDKVGLMNIVYLQEKEDGRYRIVSGLRRSMAMKSLYNEGKTVKARDRVVIFDKNTPYELLDTMSVDENLKRKDLSILEQSYKFNREAARKDKNIEEILKEYNISKKSFYRIKNAINYPVEVREIIEELGADKAEILNKIIEEEKSRKNVADVVKEYKDFNRDELREILKNLKQKTKPSPVKLKVTNRSLNLSVKKKLPVEVKEYFEKISKLIEEGDYSFMK